MFVLRLMELAWFGLVKFFLMGFFAYLDGAKNYLELGCVGSLLAGRGKNIMNWRGRSAALPLKGIIGPSRRDPNESLKYLLQVQDLKHPPAEHVLSG